MKKSSNVGGGAQGAAAKNAATDDMNVKEFYSLEFGRMLPKELYVDNVLDSISCYTTTQIAKELGITAQELNHSLCTCHIQYYQSGQYMLYAEYAHMGLAKSRTKSGVKAFDLQVPIGDAERSMKLGRSILVLTSYGRSVDASSSTTSPRECGT